MRSDVNIPTVKSRTFFLRTNTRVKAMFRLVVVNTRMRQSCQWVLSLYLNYIFFAGERGQMP